MDFISDNYASFQIPFDGGKTLHNKVKKLKKDCGNAYDRTIENLRLLSSSLSNYEVVVRINFSANSFSSLTGLLNDLNFVDKTKTTLSLHRIWQLNEKEIEKSEVRNFISEANDKGFEVSYFNCATHGVVCYADKYNEVVINYDGRVFKCTARNFMKEKEEGYLNDDGEIIWDVDKIHSRLSLPLPEICKCCSFMPACSRICSQKMLDGKQYSCITDKSLISETIVYNFQKQFKI